MGRAAPQPARCHPRSAAGTRSSISTGAAAPRGEVEPMTVGKFVTTARGEVIQASIDDKVAQVVAVLAERRIGCVPVVEAGKVVGIFSERDLVYGIARSGSGLLDRSVGEVMTKPPVTVPPDTPILSALALMTQRRIRHLPIVEAD